MASMPEQNRVVLGVDTHADTHVAVAIDEIGRRLGHVTVPTTPAGYQQLLSWASRYGTITQIGIEGTGSWGAGLNRFLTNRGYLVVEVPRPSRQERRINGRSDPYDAEVAARAALAGTGRPAKRKDGTTEMIRALRVARRSAAETRTDTLTRMRALITTGPDEIRQRLRDSSITQLVNTCRQFRMGDISSPAAATRLALRTLARRVHYLDDELKHLDAKLLQIIRHTAPELLALKGVGPDVAGTLLVTAGDNPQRFRSEAAFARLCGVAPLPASSGRTDRHRLNRGGDRQANKALWRIVICRIRSGDEATITYLTRRTSQGLSKREVIRCLKRYVAREIYRTLRP